MRFMIVILAATLSAAGLCGPTAAAEAPQAAAAPSPRQLELTRRYVNLMMTDQFEVAIGQIIAQQAALDGDMRDVPQEDQQFIVDLTVELTTDLIPQMLEAMVPVYARTFTEAELGARIEFYESDIGQSVIAKTLTAMPEANAAALTVLPQLLEKMAARLCQHYGCTPQELETLKREMRGEVSVAPRRK